jgi:hypothetical protein
MINPVLNNGAIGAQRGTSGVERDPAAPSDVTRRPDQAQEGLRVSLGAGQDPAELQEARTRFVTSAPETADVGLERARERNDQVELADQARLEDEAAERATGSTPGAVIDEFV